MHVKTVCAIPQTVFYVLSLTLKHRIFHTSEFEVVLWNPQ